MRIVHLFGRHLKVDFRHGLCAAVSVVFANGRVGLIYRHQLIVIDFLQAEYRLLKVPFRP